MRMIPDNSPASRVIGSPGALLGLSWQILLLRRRSHRGNGGRGLLQVGEDGYVEFRIVLFHVAGTVLGAELFDDGGDLFGVLDRSNLPFGLCATGLDLDGRVLEHILVPLRIGAAHGQEVELVVFGDEPDWDGDRASRLSAGHSDVDFPRAGKPVS